MNILLIQRDGIDLHHTLFASETSRMILRFYRPRKKPCGVSISCATLGSALSLVSELRWYIRRYMREALFEWENGIWFTHQLAQDVYYERTAVLGPSWPHRRLYGFREGKADHQPHHVARLHGRRSTSRSMPGSMPRSRSGARKTSWGSWWRRKRRRVGEG